MHESQVTPCASSRPARPNAFASSACPSSHVHARATSSTLGATTRPVSRSWTTSSGPPASVVVSTGFSERNASNGHHPEVLVDGCVVDAEAARVEIGEPLVRDAAGELGAAVQPAVAREPLEPLAVRPVAGDDDAQPRLGGGGLEQQVDPLRAVEPVDGEDEVVVAVAAVRERRRRVRHDLRLEPGRVAQPPGDVAGGGEDLPRLAERRPLEREHAPPQRAVLRRLGELSERRPVHVPGLAELVDEPDHLARMPHRVRRELRRDHRVDRAAVRLVEIEQPPQERLRQHALARDTT